MSRRSPPTERVKRILSLLASSTQGLTLSAIARELRINLSTCQVILNSLADGAYVVRSSKAKTYVLGPALIRLGQAARSLTPVSAVIEAELEALHGKLGFGCTVFDVVEDQMVVISQAGATEKFPVASVALGPFPFIAPFGATLMAFRPRPEIERWLKGAREVEQALHLRQVLETIRARGLNVSFMTPYTQLAMPQFERLFNTLERESASLQHTVKDVLRLLALSGSRWYLDDELRTKKKFSISLITAPLVIGNLSMELHVHVYETDVSRAELRDYTTSILATCRRIITRAGGG